MTSIDFRETKLTIDGYPALEITALMTVGQKTHIEWIQRIVIVGNAAVTMGVNVGHIIFPDVRAQRFFESFKRYPR